MCVCAPNERRCPSASGRQQQRPLLLLPAPIAHHRRTAPFAGGPAIAFYYAVLADASAGVSGARRGLNDTATVRATSSRQIGQSRGPAPSSFARASSLSALRWNGDKEAAGMSFGER